MDKKEGYRCLEKQMVSDNCSAKDFERVCKQKYTLGSEGCERLELYMCGTKLVFSSIAAVAGYLGSSAIAQNFFEEITWPRVAGGLTALVLAKLTAKPAGRVGLDIGLRL